MNNKHSSVDQRISGQRTFQQTIKVVHSSGLLYLCGTVYQESAMYT